MNNLDIKSVNKSLVLSILFVVLFILSLLGLTFAFFGVMVSGNEVASSVVVHTIDLGTVTFLDGDTISAEGIYPMAANERISKTFTITATSNEANIDYSIYLTVYENTFIQNYTKEFSYTLSGSSSSGGTVASSVNAQVPAVSNNPYLIGTGVLKSGGDTHTYTFTIGLNEMDSNQNYNQNKRFDGRLSVDSKKYTYNHSVWE